MSKKISINIGLNTPPSSGPCNKVPLAASEADARRMYDFASRSAWNVAPPYGLIIAADAKLDRVRQALESAAGELQAEDFLLVSFSGHSCHVPDLNLDEVDRDDEAWCLSDWPMIDDELASRVGDFAQGVRILFVLDTCFGDGDLNMVRMFRALNHARDFAMLGLDLTDTLKDRLSEVLFPPNDPFHQFNEQIQEKYAQGRRTPIEASVLVLASCQENEKSLNGVFTNALCDILESGNLPVTYAELYQRLYGDVQAKNGNQHPTFRPIGMPDLSFFCGKPF